jgi:chromosome segregation ATPase
LNELININNNNNILNDPMKQEDSSYLINFFNKNIPATKNENAISLEKYEKEIQEKNTEIERLNKELAGMGNILSNYESDVNKAHNKLKENEKRLLEQVNHLQQELIRKDIEGEKNSINISHIKDNKEEINSMNEIINSYKTELKIKNDLIEKFKETLKDKQNEVVRIKKEREKMAAMCRNLRAQVNQIENNNHLISNQDHERENLEYNSHNNNSNIENSVISNYFSEYEDYQQRKNQILNSKNQNLEIKKEANAHIKNAMKKNESNGLNKRTNKFFNSNISDDEMRSSQEKTKFKKYYEVMTKAKSPSRSRSNSKSPLPSENLLEAIKINKIDTSNYINKNGLKLLKRERNKSENK